MIVFEHYFLFARVAFPDLFSSLWQFHINWLAICLILQHVVKIFFHLLDLCPKLSCKFDQTILFDRGLGDPRVLVARVKTGNIQSLYGALLQCCGRLQRRGIDLVWNELNYHRLPSTEIKFWFVVIFSLILKIKFFVFRFSRCCVSVSDACIMHYMTTSKITNLVS